MLSKCVMLNNLLSQSCLSSETAICSTCRAREVYQLEEHDASCLGDHIYGCCGCQRPLIKVYTLPVVAIATVSASDSFGSLCLEWICNDCAGFWIRDGGRQGIKTTERSVSDSNAGCKAEYHANR